MCGRYTYEPPMHAKSQNMNFKNSWCFITVQFKVQHTITENAKLNNQLLTSFDSTVLPGAALHVISPQTTSIITDCTIARDIY
jgi:hypothetical protein